MTAAFWSDLDGPYVAAAEPWPEVVKHGAELVELQFTEEAAAFERIAVDFDLGLEELALLRPLFARRLAAKGSIRLSAAERELLGRAADGEEGLAACQESFGELAIFFP